MYIFNILSLLLGSGVLVSIVAYINRRLKKNDERTEAICYGIQELLKERLYHKYDKYMALGYAPIHEKEKFRDMYNRYHVLGVNGVMDQHYADFIALPDTPVNNTKGGVDNGS